MVQFSDIPVVGQVGLIEVNTAFQNDVSPLKVDLIYGTFRSEDGSNYLLPVVKRAENMVVNDTLNHNYLSPTGIEGFTKSACRLLLGDIEKLWKDGKVFGVQCMGGTGAIKIGAEFLARHMNCTTVYYPDPSWEMHGTVFSLSGFKNKIQYRYINRETIEIDFEGLCEDISNAPSDSVVILHACGHNPTGLDPSKEQWRTIAEIMKKRKLIPFFDIAYQGMASGDIEEDTWAVRHFHSEGFEFLCAQSFSKMFTVYNERVGNLTIVQKSGHNIESLKVHLERIIRSIYSSPPNHGARAVFQILSNPELYDEWLSSFKAMAARMIELRKDFRKALEEEGAFRKWNHITDQKGMFILLHLTDNQVEYLRNFHHVYMVKSGRVNVTGLNFTNINYVAKAIIDTLRKNI
ncbi:aspartate aminotransferase, cytoplasmic [Acyrthosiphon pisum]|uniref:aspartate transaminase n=1 Tax=Acyrthosiphon pisum TaxID=7029 RepID=A0A8R1W3T9_ACYPI|nr:aspartate aminotransferase, cytoplasmic [Acyrthosiphon pisum]|eukprot:XP_001943882.1 PREDICTED: aspartate aminotransferase, cytoplasmic [Acyrthosiphon pisum]